MTTKKEQCAALEAEQRRQHIDRRRKQGRLSCSRCGFCGPPVGAPEDPHQMGWAVMDHKIVCPECARR